MLCKPCGSAGALSSAGEEVNEEPCALSSCLLMEEGAEEARKVDAEKQKGEEEAVVTEPAVMGEHFVNQSALLKRKT